MIPSARSIAIVDYQATWPGEFAAIGAQLRTVFGNKALAIHHIGSTSVPGLAAKDIIDVQVSVATLEAIPHEALEQSGFIRNRHMSDHCPPGMSIPTIDLEKRLYNGAHRKTNIQMRVSGRFNQQYALLFRDYLRTNKLAADSYAEIKRQLARHFAQDIDSYYDIKDPVTDAILAGALTWSTLSAWREGPSDD